MMRFYGIVEKDNSTGKVVKKHVFRDRELAVQTFEQMKPEVKRKCSVALFSRLSQGTNIKDFAKAFELSISTNNWDEHWLMEEDFIPSHPVTINNGAMLDLLAEQLEGVLKMAILAEIDIKVLLDHTLTKNELLRENYQN